MNETEAISHLRHKGWESRGNRRPLMEDNIQVLCFSIFISNRYIDGDAEADDN